MKKNDVALNGIMNTIPAFIRNLQLELITRRQPKCKKKLRGCTCQEMNTHPFNKESDSS